MKGKLFLLTNLVVIFTLLAPAGGLAEIQPTALVLSDQSGEFIVADLAPQGDARVHYLVKALTPSQISF